MPRALRTAAAERDLEEIAYQIAVRDGRLEVAEANIRDLIAKCERIAELSPTSQMGTLAQEIGEGVRLFTHKRWVILFRYVNDGIVVLRIVDGSQDYLAWRL